MVVRIFEFASDASELKTEFGNIKRMNDHMQDHLKHVSPIRFKFHLNQLLIKSFDVWTFFVAIIQSLLNGVKWI